MSHGHGTDFVCWYGPDQIIWKTKIGTCSIALDFGEGIFMVSHFKINKFNGLSGGG